MQTRQLTNPLAPPVLAGIPDGSPENTADVDFTYNYDVTLTALQSLSDAKISIDTDSEFEWRATLVTLATGAFAVRFADSSGYYLSSGLLHSANYSTNASEPTPRFPEVPLPPGGVLNIEIVDLSNDTNDIQIVFRGVKRYRLRGDAHYPGQGSYGQQPQR